MGPYAEPQPEAIQQSHGVYTPADGWQVCPKPADTQDAWAAEMKKMKKGASFWRSKRLAHIFDDGWDEGVFHRREKDLLIFHYASVPMKYAHSLLLEEWGVSKSWVIVKQPE